MVTTVSSLVHTYMLKIIISSHTQNYLPETNALVLHSRKVIIINFKILVESLPLTLGDLVPSSGTVLLVLYNSKT